MIPIVMSRKIKGKDKLNELKKIYKSKENLKKILRTSAGNMLHQLDLENWEYYENHQNEDLEEKKTVFTENMSFNDSDFEILHIVKNNNISSLNELANKLNKEVSTIQKKVKKLEEAELLTFKKGTKNRKIPIVNYDKIEISI